MELSGSVREMTREQPLLQSEDAGEQNMNFSDFGNVSRFRECKEDLQQKDWMMCYVFIIQAKVQEAQKYVESHSNQISTSKKACHPLSVAAALAILLCVGGKMLGCFCFQDLWPRKGGHTFHKDASDDFLKVQVLDILPEIGQIEFLEGDVGCPSSVDKDACAEPLMKSCFRKIFWIPVWYPPNRNEQRWYEFKCFNTIQLYCFLLAFSSCIWF